MVMVVAVIEELIVIRDTKGSRRRNSWILAPPLGSGSGLGWLRRVVNGSRLEG